MDKINELIQCVICRSILVSPVILPCGHSICKHHSQSISDNMVRCGGCGRDHMISSDGFIDNTSLAGIIDTQFYTISLGEAHEKTKTGCKSLESMINQVNAVLADPTYKKKEEINDMRNEILLKREQLKLEIDQRADDLIEKLEQYLQKFLSEPNTKYLEESSIEIEDIKREANSKLEECKRQLDLVSLDENKWKCISDEIANELKKISDILERIQKRHVIPDFQSIQSRTRLFLNSKMNFIKPGQINSNIINTQELTYELWSVCEFESNHSFKPLYRGSENNFNWREFHAKCDNISPTFVIVKSNDGCIFGGYTKAKWNERGKSGDKFVTDSEAYVFRFMTSNLESKKYKVLKNNDALFCDDRCGPCFGKCDLEFIGNGRVFSTLNSDITDYSDITDSEMLCSNYGVPFKFRQLEISEITEVEVFQELSN